jgi:hypothetical protein
MKGKKGLVVGFLLVFSFVAINCNAQSSGNDQRIVGTWVGTDVASNTITFVFNANGSGTYMDSSDSSSRAFTYGISIDGGINMRGEYRNEGKIYFSPDGRTLFFGFSSTIYRKR